MHASKYADLFRLVKTLREGERSEASCDVFASAGLSQEDMIGTRRLSTTKIRSAASRILLNSCFYQIFESASKHPATQEPDTVHISSKNRSYRIPKHAAPFSNPDPFS